MEHAADGVSREVDVLQIEGPCGLSGRRLVGGGGFQARERWWGGGEVDGANPTGTGMGVVVRPEKQSPEGRTNHQDEEGIAQDQTGPRLGRPARRGAPTQTCPGEMPADDSSQGAKRTEDQSGEGENEGSQSQPGTRGGGKRLGRR